MPRLAPVSQPLMPVGGAVYQAADRPVGSDTEEADDLALLRAPELREQPNASTASRKWRFRSGLGIFMILSSHDKDGERYPYWPRMTATRERGRRSALRNTEADMEATEEPEAETLSRQTFHAVWRTISDYIDYDATFAPDCNTG
ncbi:hypothetical protein CMUS01_07908 [Colletotrichum musicola]|uniref:Uncharacterized protein n=1 Tax=Colletotrichum musicola TaxID=2175873 RepID=A0A8H6KFG9_9PEZI|nr:hypothetical protein CMUS01_07908 [Colletotrichum musicola]